jgi:hypothetical protein
MKQLSRQNCYTLRLQKIKQRIKKSSFKTNKFFERGE